MYIQTQALVLREAVYKESDKILTLLTPDYGKMTVKATGVRRAKSPLKAACQLLSWGEFTLFEYRNMHTIREAETKEFFPELREDLELLSLGSYFAQVAELLSQEDAPSPELFSLTLNALYALSKLHRDQNMVKAAFELRAVSQAGYTPDLSGCPVCGNPDPDRLVLREGHLECARCRTDDQIRLPVNPGALSAMRHIISCPLGQLFSFRLGPESQRILNGVTESYLLTQLERSFPTLDFYKSLFTDLTEERG